MANWQNRDRLRRKIRALSPVTREAIAGTMEKGAQRIVDLQYTLAPQLKRPDKHRQAGALKHSVDWNWGDAPGESRLASGPSSAGSGDLKITIYAGNDQAFYARWVEFGTQASVKGGRVPDGRSKTGRTRRSYRTHPGTAAQPFFFPAYRALKGGVSAAIHRAVSQAFKSVASQ